MISVSTWVYLYDQFIETIHAVCKKYNYLEANGVIVGKNDVLRGSVWCYFNCYNYYMFYTYYILNVNNMETSKYL